MTWYSNPKSVLTAQRKQLLSKSAASIARVKEWSSAISNSETGGTAM